MTTTVAPATTCRSCGRKLRAATSIAQGRGRACQAKFAAKVAAAAQTETPARLAKAVELIEDGGLQRIGHLFLAVSSDGHTRYEVAATGECSCTAAQYGRRCYHSTAAKLAA